MGLAGRTAVVTGTAHGIGTAIAKALTEDGATVHGVDKDTADLTSPQAVADFFAAIGPVDILVNNAGITRDAMLHRMTKENWDAVIHTDLDSVFNMTRLVIDGMRARNFGRIVNISSINGRKGQMGQANYSAAKAALLGFTKAVAQESAARGITVNVIAPGYIATEMVQAVPKEILDTKIIPQIPVGRLGTAEEVARCVSFLAADDAGFITGACLDVNGGQYMT